MNTPEFIKRENINSQEQYISWLADVKKRVQQARSKAIVQVNTAMLELYWSIGRDLMALHPEDKWGKGIVKQFALDMRSAFPNETGFSDTNIKYMRRWFEFYTQSAAIGQQAADQMEMPVSFGRIPWFHHVLIFTKSATVDEAFFYIQQTIKGNWSRRLLEDNMGAPGNRFEADLYDTVFECNGVEYAVSCGALSPIDADWANLRKASGVIGKDFFDHHAVAIRNGAVYASN